MLLLEFRKRVATGLPLIGTTLTFVHDITFDWGTAIILGGLPKQEDGFGTLVTPL